MDDNVIPIDPDLAPSDPAEPTVGPRPPRLPRRRHGRAQPDVLAAISLGGMLGASARFELAQALPVRPGAFPWATFWTNMSGSFLLGFLLVLILERLAPSRLLRPFLATGVMGAFTTMSTYEVETVLLLRGHHFATAAVYGLGSLVVGLVLAYAGVIAGRLSPVRHEESHA